MRPLRSDGELCGFDWSAFNRGYFRVIEDSETEEDYGEEEEVLDVVDNED